MWKVFQERSPSLLEEAIPIIAQHINDDEKFGSLRLITMISAIARVTTTTTAQNFIKLCKCAWPQRGEYCGSHLGCFFCGEDHIHQGLGFKFVGFWLRHHPKGAWEDWQLLFGAALTSTMTYPVIPEIVALSSGVDLHS